MILNVISFYTFYIKLLFIIIHNYLKIKLIGLMYGFCVQYQLYSSSKQNKEGERPLLGDFPSLLFIKYFCTSSLKRSSILSIFFLSFIVILLIINK